MMVFLEMDTDFLLLVIGGTIMLSLLAGFIIMLFFLYQRRYYRHVQEKQQLQAEFQQTLLLSQIEIQEQTLQNTSQEIHDNIGQVLSLAKLNISTMDVARPDALQQKITDSRDLVAKAIQDLRDLARGMNTGYITEMGLLRSVEYELEMIRKTGAFTTRLHVDGTPVRLDTQKELILFRIIQEILNNLIKHAGASTIIVNVSYDLQRFSITITDDGKGFDITLLDKSKNSNFGLGLRNMQNRTQLVGAEFSLTSIPQKGTSISIFLPLLSKPPK